MLIVPFVVQVVSAIVIVKVNGNTCATVFLCLIALLCSTTAAFLTVQWIAQPILLLIPEGRDITILKQAEAHAFRLAAIVESSNDAILSKDLDGTILSWNAGAERVFGYSAPEAIGSSIMILIPPERITDRTLDFLKIRQGEVEHFETERLRKDGQRIYVSMTVSPIKDKAGNITAISAIYRDITERKQMVQKLELQDKIVRTMAEGVCLVRELDGKIVYANPKFEQMFDYESGELIGQSVSQVNYEDETVDSEAIAREIMGQIAKLGEYSYEVHNVKKDGTPFWCRATSSRFDHPEYGVVYVAVHEDITARKALEQELAHQRYLLEQELAHNRQLLDTFITSAPVGMCVLDNQLRYTLVNEALANYQGISAADHLGKTVWQVVPSLAATQAQAFQRALVTGESILGAEFVGENPNFPGVKRTWLVSLFPMKTQTQLLSKNSSQAAADSLGVIITDITERKQVEEQVKASLEEKEVLLQEIHHRVKNNLQIVDGLLQMQQRRIQDENAAAILRESQHRIKSIALVHEKLYRSDDLAHIDFPNYVHSLVTNLVDSYQNSASSITYLLQIEDITLPIDTAIPCGLIINELVSNALKYAFPNNRMGEIHIKFYYSKPEGDWLTLIVEDDGIGMPPDIDLQQIKSLGLKLVRGLVAQLEGKLEVECQQGTSIKVIFPRNQT